jgi:galactokinase
MSESDRAQLIQLCQQLGAPPGQAAAMTDQLLKRCDQLVAERGIGRVEAMAYLLQLVTKGARGEAPPGFEGVASPKAAPVAKPVDGVASATKLDDSSMQAKLSAVFRQTYGREPEIITRAPGRIEFIGNHTDYNGGTVLGAAVDRGVWVALARRTDGERRLYSEFGGEIVTQSGVPEPVRGDHSWVNYPLGVIAALPEFGLRAPEGFDYVAASDLPTGAGLSSSAAIELASALAFLAATDQRAPREVVVKVGKHAENHFVGVPCGILDQGVSGFGQKDHMVFIDCRGPRFSTVPMPPDVHFWIFNTHTKHALVDGLYAARHRECMEAAKSLGVALLADADTAKLEAGRAHLSEVAYKRARHVIEEIARVDATCRALEHGDLPKVGAALTASHRSSQHLFENSTPELDFLVDQLATTAGVLGARLTGGGFGGAVMALTTSSFRETAAHEVAEAYAARFGARPDVLHMQTGPGAEVVVG